MKKKRLVALIDVAPRKGCVALGKIKGAYVNIVALADGKAEYLRLIRAALKDYGYDMTSLQNLQDFDLLAETKEVEAELRRNAKRLSPANRVQFGTFHAY